MIAGKVNVTFVFVLLGAGLMPVAANADLIGSTLSWQYYGGGSPYNPATGGSVTSGTFVAGGGVDGTFIDPGPEDVFNILTTGTTITFDFSPDTAASPFSSSPLSLSPTIYNGIAINLLSAGSFSDVTIDPSTNMAGFLPGDVSFTGDQIQVNWADLGFTTATIVTLDVTVGNTPEPGTFGLVFACLLAAAALRARAWSRPVWRR